MRKSNLEYLLTKTANLAFSDAEYLFRFIKTSASTYKYPVADQILICAQIRNPTAVATFEQWHRLGRSVNRGAIGAYHFSGDSSRGIKGDLFDVSDTAGPDGTYPGLWQMPVNFNFTGQLDVQGDQAEAIAHLIDENIAQIFAAASGSLPAAVSKHQVLASQIAQCIIIERLQLPAYNETVNTYHALIASRLPQQDILSLTTDDRFQILQVATTTSSKILRQIERSVKHESQRHEADRATPTTRNQDHERDAVPPRSTDPDLSPGNRQSAIEQVRGTSPEAAPGEQPGQGRGADGGEPVLDVPGGAWRTTGDHVREANGPDEAGLKGAGQLQSESGVAEPDAPDSPRADFTGDQQSDSLAELLEVTPEQLDMIRSVIAYDDGFNGTIQRIDAFFNEEGDQGKRTAYLKDTYQTSNAMRDLDDYKWQYTTSDAGMLVEVTGWQDAEPNFIKLLGWDQVERVVNSIVAEEGWYKDEQEQYNYNAVFDVTAAVHIPTQLSLFDTEEKKITDDDYLREQLCKYGPHAGAREQIASLFQNSASQGKLAQAIKKIYGTYGHSCTFSDGKFGFIHYEPKGVFLRVDAPDNRADHTARYTWNRVTQIIRDLVENDLYQQTNPVEININEETQPLFAPEEPPTLKDILAQPDQMPALAITHGISEVVQLPQTPTSLSELFGFGTDRIPLDLGDQVYLYHDKHWHTSKRIANFWLDENQRQHRTEAERQKI